MCTKKLSNLEIYGNLLFVTFLLDQKFMNFSGLCEQIFRFPFKNPKKGKAAQLVDGFNPFETQGWK